MFFELDSSALDADARTTLERQAFFLRKYPSVSISVEGHCDERGTNEYNLALGQRRALSARDYLVQAGVESERLMMISYGEEKPFAYGHDELSWRQNRRAHFVQRMRDAS